MGFRTSAARNDLDPLYLFARALIKGSVGEVDKSFITSMGVWVACLSPYARLLGVHSF